MATLGCINCIKSVTFVKIGGICLQKLFVLVLSWASHPAGLSLLIQCQKFTSSFMISGVSIDFHVLMSSLVFISFPAHFNSFLLAVSLMCFIKINHLLAACIWILSWTVFPLCLNVKLSFIISHDGLEKCKHSKSFMTALLEFVKKSFLPRLLKLPLIRENNICSGVVSWTDFSSAERVQFSLTGSFIVILCY